ncbi:MAG: ABC transporter permease subunit [Thermodesulfobacteriota bacterium]
MTIRREKTVRRAVLWADRLADRVITVGGVSVIVAVLGILVFLVVEVMPLFSGARITGSSRHAIADPPITVLASGMDEYHTLVYLVLPEGRIRVIHAETGTDLESVSIGSEGAEIRCVAEAMDREHLAVGYSDGKVRMVDLKFDVQVIPEGQTPVTGMISLNARDRTDGKSVYSLLPNQQVRVVRFVPVMEEPVSLGTSEGAITAIAFQSGGKAERSTSILVTRTEDGRMNVNRIERRMNLMTGQTKTVIENTELPDLPGPVEIFSMCLSEQADTLLIAAVDGRVFRYNLQRPEQPMLAEIARVLPQNVRLSAIHYLVGGQAVLVGGSDGSLRLFFPINEETMGTPDKRVLVEARRFDLLPGAVLQISPASRGKTFAVSTDTGHVRVIHATSRKTLLDVTPGSVEPPTATILSPRMDAVFALLRSGSTDLVRFSAPHPETDFATLFQRVWYEGYPQPTFTWQSSSGSDSFESKFSLVPLVFGSVKAALYSLLFAVPIAILAAIYTSEFVHPKVRGMLKPTMEIMASIPSVVLGFIAALVLAPIVEHWVAAVILTFMLLPVLLLAASILWQWVPQHVAERTGGWVRMVGAVGVIVLAIFGSMKGFAWFESAFFGGDFKMWLTQPPRQAVPFLFLLFFPLTVVLVGLLYNRFINPWMIGVYARASLQRARRYDLLRWTCLAVIAVVLDLAIASAAAALGFDARGGIVGTYVQRNTLIVGFAMGFAVIPLIFSIAEDALNSVPNHLRAASLACGATRWQTVLYVVLPAAMSGVFSAVMIGLGRAVGETMIVVMAAGNTPILDWNIFNGLRSLSATIAVELPEAVKGGTLYRVLFLSALVLFAMTFVINTVAEIVRLRFRKRAAQL